MESMATQKTILISDDNTVNRQLLRRIFEDEYRVLEATNGAQTLEILQDNPDISVVALDLHMPIIDGYGVLAALKNTPEIAHIPVVVVTAMNDIQTQIKVLEEGAIDIIAKPFDTQLVRSRIHNIVARTDMLLLQEENRLMQSLLHQAECDEKTGLFTRSAFCRHTAAFLAEHTQNRYVIFRWDLDNFKVFNATYGVDAGDRLLSNMATAFQQGGSDNALLGRLQADHFVGCFPAENFDATALLTVLKSYLKQAYQDFDFSLRAGVYYIEDPRLDISIMCDRAGMALDAAKGNYLHRTTVFDQEMLHTLLEEQSIVREMQSALQRGEFVVYMQPQYNYVTGTLSGAEALVRWNHPKKGLLSPNKFIPIFEQNGFIRMLDYAVFKQVCQWMRKQLNQQLPICPISVNISRVDLFNSRLCDSLLRLTEQYNLAPTLLRLEITESAYMDDATQLIESVQTLRTAGFSVEIDDFGSGYSSLNTLRDLPVDALKLDMNFLGRTQSKDRSGRILSSVIRMAHWLNIPVIAEGVEHLHDADFLKSVGCHVMQGYYFAKPMTLEAFEQLLQNHPVQKEDTVFEGTVEGAIDPLNFQDASSQETLLFNSYVGGAAIVERRGNLVEVIRVNDSFLTTTGIPRADFFANGPDFLTRLEQEFSALLLNRMDTAISTANETDCELRISFTGEKKNVVWLLVRLRHLAKNGAGDLFYLSVENITQRKNLLRHNQKLNKQLTQVLNSISGGIISSTLTKDSLNLTYINAPLAKMFGYTVAEFQSLFFDAPDKAIHPDDVAQCVETIYAYFANPTPVMNFCYRHLCKDGSWKWIQNTCNVTHQEHDITYLNSIVIDVSELKEAEQARLDLTHQLQNIFDYTPGGLAVYSLRGNQYQAITRNDGFWDVFGYPLDERQNVLVEEELSRVHPEDIAALWDKIHACIGKDMTLSHTYRTFHKVKHRYVYITASGRAVPQTDGSYLYYVNYSDVTDRVEIEQQVDRALANVSGGLAQYEIGETVRLTMFTEGLLKLFGYTMEDEAVFKCADPLSRVYQYDRTELQQILAKSIETNSEFHHTYRVHCKNNQLIWVTLAAYPAGYSESGYPLYHAICTGTSQQLELYRNIMDEADVCFLVIDAETYEVYYANETAFTMVGVAKQSYAGKKCYELFFGLMQPCNFCFLTDRNCMQCCKEVYLPNVDKTIRVSAHRSTWLGRSVFVECCSDISYETKYRKNLEIERERYQRILDLGDMALFDYDVLTDAYFVNEAFYKFFQQDNIYFVEKRLPIDPSIVHPEDLDALHTFVDTLYLREKIAKLDLRIRLDGEDFRWICIQCYMDHLETGELARITGTLKDIHQEKMEELYELEQYEAALNRQVGTEKSLISQVTYNLSQNKIFKHEPGELAIDLMPDGTPIAAFNQQVTTNIAPMDASKTNQDIFSLDSLLGAFAENTPVSQDYRRIHKNGQTIWVRTNITFMKNPYSGDKLAFASTYDINEEKYTADLMQRMAIDYFEYLSIIHAENGIVQFALAKHQNSHSPTIGELFNNGVAYSAEHFIHASERECFVKDHSLEQILSALSKQSEYTLSSNVYYAKENAVFRKLWRYSWLDDSKTYICLTRSDITAMHQQELKKEEQMAEALRRAEQANRAKNVFLSSMSHDMRTPMNAIVGFAGLGAKSTNLQEAVQLLQKIELSGKYLSSLINDILEMSNAENGNQVLHPVPLTYTEFYQEVMTIVQPRAEEKGIHLHVPMPSFETQSVLVDREKLCQIFINLITNAIKFTPTGGTVAFFTNASITDNKRIQLLFTVKDTGIGMSEEFVSERMYRLFERESRPYTETIAGTGVGLATVKHLVELMDGRIECHSKIDHGTTFEVCLTLEMVSSFPDIAAKPHRSSLQGMHILLCEDTPASAQFMTMLLQRKGIEVTWAKNGKIGVDTFADSQPFWYDAILMDIMMPEMNGLEATKVVRAMKRPDSATIPIFAVSANSFTKDVESAKAAGINTLLQKPVNAKQLFRLLRDITPFEQP